MKKIPAKYAHNPRYQAVYALTRIASGSYSNILVSRILDEKQMSIPDGKLFTEIVYGVLNHRLSLEYQLARFVKKPQALEEWVKWLLLTGLYQLHFLAKVPDHAVLNESVEIAKTLGHTGIGKLVNGVLRNVQRQGFSDYSELKDPLERLSIATSFPRVLLDYLVPQLGLEKTAALAESLLTPSHVSARVDLQKISRAEAIAFLATEGLTVKESPIALAGIIGEKGALATSGLFKKGWLTIQDESSMLVAPAMTLAPDAQVLDACAAPGGKTTHMASLLTTGHVTALDLHEHKVKLIMDNAKRLGVADRVSAKVMDARKVATTFPKESFDAILVDAPCSGLGLMRRKPDIKYQKNPQEFLKLPEIQLEILNSCAPTLKQWGIMVYSTCTITQEENRGVLTQFLQAHPEFVLTEVQVQGAQSKVVDQTLTLLPQDFQTDGFFISRLQKIAPTSNS